MSTAAEVDELVNALRYAYPAAFLPVGEWDHVLETWGPPLRPYPLPVLQRTFGEARSRHPEKFPTLQQVLLLAHENYRRQQEHLGQKRLVDHPKLEPAEARRKLERACDQLEHDGDEITDANLDHVEQAVAALGMALGVPHERMVGEQKHPQPERRFNTARAFALCFRSNETSPASVAKGLRRALDVCARMPTFGLVLELARGGDGRAYPGGFLRDTEPEPERVVDNAITRMGDAWREESELRQLDPNKPSPTDIGRRRLADIRGVLDRHFPTMDLNAAIEPRRRSHQQPSREPGEDDAQPETGPAIIHGSEMKPDTVAATSEKIEPRPETIGPQEEACPV